LIEEYFFRFVFGGFAVSAFAVLGDIFRPKTFAGLFGAAPSIAIATLAMAAGKQGLSYAAIEGRSMIIGALSLCLYCVIVCHLLKRRRLSAWFSAILALPLWLACALSLNRLLLG